MLTATSMKGIDCHDECHGGIENDMDGEEAISTAFATVPGSDYIREVPKLGYRLKVYRCLKALVEESEVTSLIKWPTGINIVILICN